MYSKLTKQVLYSVNSLLNMNRPVGLRPIAGRFARLQLVLGHDKVRGLIVCFFFVFFLFHVFRCLMLFASAIVISRFVCYLRFLNYLNIFNFC